jgi:glucan 1,3-beta-glucosidase
LLEPGPADPLFDKHADPDAEVRCEWELMISLKQQYGDEGMRKVVKEHRDKHITRDDFVRMKACGLNAVRVPFGYWIVTGPTHGDPYVGPAMEYIDNAVQWAEELGLQVMLDLHGCPGGESGEAPSGRRQRPHGTWQWQHWRMEESLRCLEIVAKRYQGQKCVTGIAVCNEPSNTVPLTRLCQYYDQAIDVVRGAGMTEKHVAAVLPVFQRPEDKFAKRWKALTGSKHSNFCFDVHCYHCFENNFNGKTCAQQLRAVHENEEMLRKYPMVVGEWSLALGVATWSTCGELQEAEVYRLFGQAQQRAFQEASHGRFFWNWTERADTVEWNYQVAYKQGLLTGPAPELPAWTGEGEDPLEEVMHPSPDQPCIHFGEKVWLRTFYGRYVDVFGSRVGAAWPDKGSWQAFTFCPGQRTKSESSSRRERRPVRHGDTIMLRAHNGRFLTVQGECVSASEDAGSSSRFVAHMETNGDLRHRGYVMLQSKSTRRCLDADDAEDGIFARFYDFGVWQKFGVEKVVPLGRGQSLESLRSRGQSMESLRSTESLDSSPDALSKEQPLAADAEQTKKRKSSTSVPVPSVEVMETPKRRRVGEKRMSSLRVNRAETTKVRSFVFSWHE